MSREVSCVVEQLVVFAKLLCRVERLHALRTDETLHKETAQQLIKQLQVYTLVQKKKVTSDV